VIQIYEHRDSRRSFTLVPDNKVGLVYRNDFIRRRSLRDNILATGNSQEQKQDTKYGEILESQRGSHILQNRRGSFSCEAQQMSSGEPQDLYRVGATDIHEHRRLSLTGH